MLELKVNARARSKCQARARIESRITNEDK